MFDVIHCTYVWLCVCYFTFSRFLFLRSHQCLLCALSLVCYTQREIIPLSNMSPSTFTFFSSIAGRSIALELFENMRRQPTETDGIVFLGTILLDERVSYKFAFLSVLARCLPRHSSVNRMPNDASSAVTLHSTSHCLAGVQDLERTF